MLCVQFIFAPGDYDETFHALDAEIDAFAQALPGYVGVDRWTRPGQQNSIYYFRDRDSLTELARFPQHLSAKRDYAQWYDGYQILVSELSGSYGDGRIPHPAVEASS